MCTSYLPVARPQTLCKFRFQLAWPSHSGEYEPELDGQFIRITHVYIRIVSALLIVPRFISRRQGDLISLLPSLQRYIKFPNGGAEEHRFMTGSDRTHPMGGGSIEIQYKRYPIIHSYPHILPQNPAPFI